METKVYELGIVKDEELKFAVIVSKYKGKFVYARHKERETWETPGGHRELNEDINDTAARELREETGADKFTIRPICDYLCDYSIERENVDKSYGRLYYAEIEKLGELPDLEIAEIALFESMPENLTYPEIQPVLFHRVLRELFNKELKQPPGNNFIIEKGTTNDIDELESLYDDLNDYLEAGTNYAGWAKGIYPIRETAIIGVQNNNLFVVKINNKIAGSVILNHEPETAYAKVSWAIEADYKDIIVIHTLVVHPKFLKSGVGKELMEFARRYSKQEQMKAIRLDVSIHNTPAISLYENCEYEYVETVDLGLNIPGLVWFKLYELVL